MRRFREIKLPEQIKESMRRAEEYAEELQRRIEMYNAITLELEQEIENGTAIRVTDEEVNYTLSDFEDEYLDELPEDDRIKADDVRDMRNMTTDEMIENELLEFDDEFDFEIDLE